MRFPLVVLAALLTTCAGAREPAPATPARCRPFERPITVAPGLVVRSLRCAVPGGEPLAVRALDVDLAQGLDLVAPANETRLQDDGARCPGRYPAWSPGEFIKGSTALLAFTNGSLFHRGGAPRGALAAVSPRWEPDGLAWSSALTSSDQPGLQSPLQFDECRNEPALMLVFARDGLHEESFALAPCPGTDPDADARTNAQTEGGGARGNPWCGGTDGPALWARRHVEACAVNAAGASIRSDAMVAYLQQRYPGTTAVLQITGPWPSFNAGQLAADGTLVGDGGADHPLRCDAEVLRQTAGLRLPVINGIQRAICGPHERTVVCDRGAGAVSLVISDAVSLYGLAEVLRSPEGLGCARAYNLDGGGSTQLAIRDGARSREFGPQVRAPLGGERDCGAHRAPPNVVGVVRRRAP